VKPDEVLTKADEHNIAKDIVNVLLQKKCSYSQAKRILKDAKKEMAETPIE